MKSAELAARKNPAVIRKMDGTHWAVCPCGWTKKKLPSFVKGLEALKHHIATSCPELEL